MCCLLCLHRHQIHLISYGFVSFGLIATGLVFTIFAIFQKDSQIGKVWLAGPTTMVVGLVLCGKVIIDWGPGMAHGLNAEDSVDALDQLTMVNPALNGNGGLMMNGGFGGANGAFQQLKAPIHGGFDNNLTPPTNLSPLLPPNATVFSHFKKKTSNAYSSNNGSMRNYGSAFALPTTELISRGGSAASLTLNECGKKTEEPPDLLVTSALAGRNGAIDCIQYASDVNSSATSPAAPSPKPSAQDPIVAQLSHSVPPQQQQQQQQQQRLEFIMSQQLQNSNKNKSALYDSLRTTTDNYNNNNYNNSSSNKPAGQPTVMQIPCQHTVSTATQTESVASDASNAIVLSGCRSLQSALRCNCNSLAVVASKSSTSTVNSLPLVRHRMNSWTTAGGSGGGGGSCAFYKSLTSSTFCPPHFVDSTTVDNNYTGYCKGFAGGCCCYYCSYAAVMLAASQVDSKAAYCPIARHSYDGAYGPPRVTVIRGGGDKKTECAYGRGNSPSAPNNYYSTSVLSCAMHDHSNHCRNPSLSGGVVEAAASGASFDITGDVKWRRESTSTADAAAGGGGSGENVAVIERRPPSTESAVGGSSSTLAQGETFVLNERKFFI